MHMQLAEGNYKKLKRLNFPKIQIKLEEKNNEDIPNIQNITPNTRPRLDDPVSDPDQSTECVAFPYSSDTEVIF